MKILLSGHGLDSQYGRLLTGRYAMEAATDADTVLSLAANSTYDCFIVTDGCSNPYQLIRSLRTFGIQAPVFCILHQGDAKDRVQALSAGADDCMTMPGDHSELTARVQALLRRRSTYTAENLTCFGVELDPAQNMLRVGENAEPLTRMEFHVMQLLMSNPSVSFTAQEILTRVWTSDSPADVNTVWVYISRLRTKLTKLNAGAAIRSRRNLGYAMCEA